MLLAIGLLKILFFRKHWKVKLLKRTRRFLFLSIGNIDQNQYVDKVRIILDFIAPRISKEDIETIWKMQVGNSVIISHGNILSFSMVVH
jgi:hypothetical protein